MQSLCVRTSHQWQKRQVLAGARAHSTTYVLAVAWSTHTAHPSPAPTSQHARTQTHKDALTCRVPAVSVCACLVWCDVRRWCHPTRPTLRCTQRHWNDLSPADRLCLVQGAPAPDLKLKLGCCSCHTVIVYAWEGSVGHMQRRILYCAAVRPASQQPRLVSCPITPRGLCRT